ncbi:threonine/serine ThrE exporter family protein [Sandaracinus amylolyticus]|uniref:Threonine/serine exporter-like N-terminal domain-containing protein n=1 Tax=Sandaracinus amylolyticus TaxID=927083 RepID=A0A0F6W8T7_9BACT|nr:threonine/serine exporter family protein [Sandaracinus amylolyticus]AKF10323.1 Hypothetical protein DB32_007472 [Sandaracinus amylolyticus]
MDLWILQAARVLDRRRRSERGSLDSLVHGEALAEHAADGLDPSLAFSLRLARALLGCGMPAQRVEESLYRLAESLGFDIDAFCTPTALIVTMSKEGATGPHDVRTRVVRVEPGQTDLERLSALHDLVGRVERREITPGDGARRIEAILARRPRWNDTSIALAFGLVSMAASILLGGGGLDLPIAGALGVLVGVLDAIGHRVPAVQRLLPALAASSVSFLASMLAWQGVPVRPSVVLLASIVVLLPGLTVTTATLELATANLVSGTARLMGGAVTFLQLGFGVALGLEIAKMLPHIPAPPPPDALPAWAVLVAPLGSALGFTVLLRAKPADGVWVLFAVVLALAGSQLGGRLMGAELGAFVGALVVASASHVFARWRDRPVNLMLVPGILFLVPGSIGFLSIRSLLEHDVEGAVSTAFRMSIVAMALAAGILVATAAVPPRKAL